MALLRFLHSPSLAYYYFPTQQQQQQQQFSRTHFYNISTTYKYNLFPLSHSHSLSVQTKTHTNFLLRSTSTTQEQLLDSSSPNVPIETQVLEPQAEEFTRNRLIAQNVPWNCTTEDVRALFEKHGTVIDVELSMHNKTRNRGLAFVTMGSPEDALTALNNLESYEFEGRTLKINYARARKKKSPHSRPAQPKPLTFNLFVANLPFEARSKDLREFFGSGSSTVVSAHVIFHENPRKSSGYGFVAFKTKRDADEALSAFQGKILMGRPIRVARSRQFVKLPVEESAQSGDASIELNTSAEQADTADEN